MVNGQETLKEKTAQGLLWGGISNGIQQLLSLLFGIFLARILTQYDYGIIGMLAIFSSLASSLQEGGFISALICKRDITHKDYNAVFWFNLLISSVIYIVLFFCAPLISRFYGIAELKSLARYIFLGFLIASLNVVPRAYLMRNMMVRETTLMSIIALIISGLTGIGMALAGFAYWGIATQTIVFNVCITLMSFYLTSWRPTLPINLRPLINMISFSSKLIVTNIINIINNNIFSVLLGKFYSPYEVGNYTQASKWNTMGWQFVSNMLNGIAQPVFSKTVEDKKRQKHIFRKLLRFTALISFPTMLGLAFVSKEFIIILLTDKWLDSAMILQLLCISGAFIPLSNLFSNLIISRGHSSTYMWGALSLCLFQLSAVFMSSAFGIKLMVLVYVIITICWLLIWFLLIRREINLKLGEVLKDITPYLFLTIFSIALTWLLTKEIASIYLSFCTKALLVSSLYCLSLWLLKSTIFHEMIMYITKKELPI